MVSRLIRVNGKGQNAFSSAALSRWNAVEAEKFRVLNAGCGPASPRSLHACFQRPDWGETRIDIDPRVEPDIVGSVVDLTRDIADMTFDAVWTSHNLEHLRAHEVKGALAEFYRILKPTGFMFVTCPDLEAVARHLLAKGLEAEAYMSASGAISAIDMIFGHSASIERGNDFMAHRTGFSVERLGRLGLEAGFVEAHVAPGDDFALWGLFLMPETNLDAVAALLAPTPQAFLLS